MTLSKDRFKIKKVRFAEKNAISTLEINDKNKMKEKLHTGDKI